MKPTKPAPKPRPKVKISAGPKTVKKPRKPVKKTESKPELSNLDRAFCHQYQIDQNGTQAYLRVKPHVKITTARSEAAKILVKPNVKALLKELALITSEKAGLSALEVVNHAIRMVKADPRELVEVRLGCCRHCYGLNFLYQFTQNELLRAREQHNANQQAKIDRKKGYIAIEFDEQGGSGFDRRKPPHPDCPECAGEGVSRVVLKDTQNLSPEALRLLAGVKEGKDGIEIKVHSVDASLDKLFRHHGLYNDKLQLIKPKAKIKDMTGRKPVKDGDGD